MGHQKGFTLIELIVTLGLAGIIISIVFSFFIMNIKSYETINTQSERQYQSQSAINFMTNKILEAEKFTKDETDVDNTVYKFEHSTNNFSFKLDGEVLKFYKEVGGTTQTINVVSYVDTFKIETGSNDSKVIISLKLLKDKEVAQIVHMRNYTKP